jgi:hypothetical protein
MAVGMFLAIVALKRLKKGEKMKEGRLEIAPSYAILHFLQNLLRL